MLRYVWNKVLRLFKHSKDALKKFSGVFTVHLHQNQLEGLLKYRVLGPTRVPNPEGLQ